jgi:hypothetical protein
LGGASTAPPPASIAAYCSRAAPPSVADDGPSDAITPHNGGFPLCSLFVTWRQSPWVMVDVCVRCVRCVWCVRYWFCVR